MLWDIASQREITTIPHSEAYDRWMSALSDDEVSEIKDALNKMIDGTEVQTSSWMPGKVWRGTPFRVIFEKAAHGDHDVARKCFGIIVWEVFMERPEYWASDRYEKDGVPIEGRTYFQVHPN